MARLLFEAWEMPKSGGLMFYSVSEEADLFRRKTEPDARFLYSLWASTGDEASQGHYDRQGWGRYKPSGYGDDAFTDEQALEQARYLATRASPAG